jgi:hypothetical protein
MQHVCIWEPAPPTGVDNPLFVFWSEASLPRSECEMLDCFLVLLGIYSQIVRGGYFFLMSSYKMYVAVQKIPRV